MDQLAMPSADHAYGCRPRYSDLILMKKERKKSELVKNNPELAKLPVCGLFGGLVRFGRCCGLVSAST
jgi:hypothetical protein